MTPQRCREEGKLAAARGFVKGREVGIAAPKLSCTHMRRASFHQGAPHSSTQSFKKRNLSVPSFPSSAPEQAAETTAQGVREGEKRGPPCHPKPHLGLDHPGHCAWQQSGVCTEHTSGTGGDSKGRRRNKRRLLGLCPLGPQHRVGPQDGLLDA